MATLTLAPVNLGRGFIGQTITSGETISGSIANMVYDESFWNHPRISYDYDQARTEGRNTMTTELVWNGHNLSFSKGSITYTVVTLGVTNIYAKVFLQDNDGSTPDCQFANTIIGTVEGVATPAWITPVTNRTANSRTTAADINRMVSNASVLANMPIGKMNYTSNDFVYDTEWNKLIQHTNIFADALGIPRATASTSYTNLNRIEDIAKKYRQSMAVVPSNSLYPNESLVPVQGE